jgi:hypothetical protein
MLDPDPKHCLSLSPHVLEEKKGGVGGEGEDGGHGEHVAVLHRLHPAIKLPSNIINIQKNQNQKPKKIKIKTNFFCRKGSDRIKTTNQIFKTRL